MNNMDRRPPHIAVKSLIRDVRGRRDRTARALLAALLADARTPVTTLAKRLGVARTTVRARLARLETIGVITYWIQRAAESRRPRA